MSLLASTNRNVQARMSPRGIGIAVLPQIAGHQVSGLRRLHLPGRAACKGDPDRLSPRPAVTDSAAGAHCNRE